MYFHSAPTRSFLSLFCVGWLLTGCLPDSNSNRYAQINYQTHIENTGISLMHAAHQFNGWQVGRGMRRKPPLDSKSALTDLVTVNAGPAPQAPAGMTVAACGPYSAVAYFNAVPKGIDKLPASGPLMMAALSKRYGGRNVGMQAQAGPMLPAVATDLACTVGADIVVGSPIVMVGFAYGDQIMPDPRKALSPVMTRDITIPCPSGTNGVIKREQECTLLIDDNEKEAEEGEIHLGGNQLSDLEGSGAVNDLVRLKRTWECTPDLAALPGATGDEISRFCRDPANDLVKPPDNTFQMSWDSLQYQLESTGPGVYTFQCRNNGTNGCAATPYTPPPKTTLSCAPVTTPPFYVVNPLYPLEIDGAGNILGEPNATRDCGRGWTGKLHARYMVRRCNLIKDGQVIGSKQSIYHIANAAAQCSKELNDVKQACPYPYNGSMLVRKRFDMTVPLALDWNEYVPGGTYTPSNRIAWSGSRPEVIQSAQNQSYYLAKNNFQTVPDAQFDNKLTSEMKDFMNSTITACSLAGAENCITPPEPIKLMIVIDNSTSMDDNGGEAAVSYKQCRASGYDLFKPEYADLACAAIDQYHNYVNGGSSTPSDDEDPRIEQFESGGDYLQEDALRQLLHESYLSPELYDRFTDYFLYSNMQGCHNIVSDQYGYCLSQVTTNDQGTCPGTCVENGRFISGSKQRITAEQIPALLSYIPPGSEVRYVEFGEDYATTDASFCNTTTDPNCDFSGQLGNFRNQVNSVNNNVRTSTNLMTTLTDQMSFFGGDKGILLIVSDGKETDTCSFKYNYIGFCSAESFESCYNNYSVCQKAQIVGVPNADEAFTRLELAFSEKCINLDSSDTEAVSICEAIDTYLNTTVTPHVLKGTKWQECQAIDSSPKPRMIDWIGANYPLVEVKVFQFQQGGQGTLGCPDTIPLDDRLQFDFGLQEVFKKIQPQKSSPNDICARLGSNIPIY